MITKIKEKMFYSIGEVEKITGIKKHVIRSWEKNIPSLIPIRHNNRRLYTKKTLQILEDAKNMIKNHGYKVSAAETAIKNNLQKKTNKITINETVEDLKKILENIDSAISKLKI